MECRRCGREEDVFEGFCMSCHKEIVPLEVDVKKYIATVKQADKLRKQIERRGEGITFCGMYGYIQTGSGLLKVAHIMGVEVDEKALVLSANNVHIATTKDADGIYYVQVEQIR